MTSQKYFERLLIVVVIFCVFFFITMMLLSVMIQGFAIDFNTRNGKLIASTIQALMVFIAPSLVAARLITRSPLSYLELKKAPGWLPILGAIFAYMIALPAMNQIIYWNSTMILPEWIADWGVDFKQMEESAQNSASMMLDTASFGGMIINLLVIGLLTAFGEEIFFRGALQRTVAAPGWNHLAIWIVAIIFSAAHFQIFGFFPRLILGAWLGYLLYWTRSLYVPVFAHFLNNAVVVVCSWLSFKGIEFNQDMFGVVESGFPFPALVSALALFIFLFCFKNFFFKSKADKSKKSYESGLQLEN